MKVVCPVVCPVCQARFDITQGQNGRIYLELADIASKFGPLWKLADEYIEAFRQEQYSGILLKRRVRILIGLLKLWQYCTFSFRGKLYRATHEQIHNSITIVCDQEKFGFKDHNYLKAVLVDKSERISANGMTAREETAREEKRRSEAADRGAAETEKEGTPMATAEFKEKIGALADQIGRDVP